MVASVLVIALASGQTRQSDIVSAIFGTWKITKIFAAGHTYDEFVKEGNKHKWAANDKVERDFQRVKRQTGDLLKLRWMFRPDHSYEVTGFPKGEVHSGHWLYQPGLDYIFMENALSGKSLSLFPDPAAKALRWYKGPITFLLSRIVIAPKHARALRRSANPKLKRA